MAAQFTRMVSHLDFTSITLPKPRWLIVQTSTANLQLDSEEVQSGHSAVTQANLPLVKWRPKLKVAIRKLVSSQVIRNLQLGV